MIITITIEKLNIIITKTDNVNSGIALKICNKHVKDRNEKVIITTQNIYVISIQKEVKKFLHI